MLWCTATIAVNIFDDVKCLTGTDMKSFSKWTIAEVEDTFHLSLQKTHILLSQWLEDITAPTQAEISLLLTLRDRLEERVWELKGKFIFPLLIAVNFDSEQYQAFIEREIAVEIDNEPLSGMVDFFVATGKRYPKQPYFFIHEFKKEHDASGDPLGQLLITMVAAQKLNNDGNPIYGCYVMGRFWFFVVLQGQAYANSLAYDATKEDDIQMIFSLLQKTKGIIARLLTAE